MPSIERTSLSATATSSAGNSPRAAAVVMEAPRWHLRAHVSAGGDLLKSPPGLNVSMSSEPSITASVKFSSGCAEREPCLSGRRRTAYPAPPLVSGSDPQLPGHHHPGADVHPAVQIHNVLVVHPNAAVRDEAADRARRVGTVDGIFTAAGQRHCRRPHRIIR